VGGDDAKLVRGLVVERERPPEHPDLRRQHLQRPLEKDEGLEGAGERIPHLREQRQLPALAGFRREPDALVHHVEVLVGPDLERAPAGRLVDRQGPGPGPHGHLDHHLCDVPQLGEEGRGVRRLLEHPVGDGPQVVQARTMIAEEAQHALLVPPQVEHAREAVEDVTGFRARGGLHPRQRLLELERVAGLLDAERVRGGVPLRPRSEEIEKDRVVAALPGREPVDQDEPARREEVGISVDDGLGGTIGADVDQRPVPARAGGYKVRHETVNGRSGVDFPDDIIASDHASDEAVKS
jgi:hypothetical protein